MKQVRIKNKANIIAGKLLAEIVRENGISRREMAGVLGTTRDFYSLLVSGNRAITRVHHRNMAKMFKERGIDTTEFDKAYHNRRMIKLSVLELSEGLEEHLSARGIGADTIAEIAQTLLDRHEWEPKK